MMFFNTTNIVVFLLSFFLSFHLFLQKEDKVDEKDRKWDPIELFIKNMLKPAQPGKPHTSELQERLLRECVREYPYRESNLLRQMVRFKNSSG